uniref:Uncharacterized protein n=1 Tax=Caenorhabditis japonica TaxID=281687 RepID=A0A8R1IZS4_CAEJA
MARYGSVFKLLHANPDFIDKTADSDLILFVLYSLNKHRRWEILDKIWAHIVPHFANIVPGAKIKNCYERKNDKFTEKHFRGIGRFYGDDTKKEKGESTQLKIVTYNVVRAPRNYKKYFANDYRKWKRRKDSTYHRKGEFYPETILEDWKEYYENPTLYSENNKQISTISEKTKRPEKFYNFSNHMVSSNRRKNKNKMDLFLFDLSFISTHK